MRVLLVHPDDSPLDGGWSSLPWDLVIDLGWAGSLQYAAWTEKLQIPVRSYFHFADWHDDVIEIQKACGVGTMRLVDAEGIDWWEWFAPLRYQQVFEVLLLRKVAREIQRPAEVRVTRPHRLADTLGKLLGVRVDPLLNDSSRGAGRFSGFAKKLRTLTAAQAVQIACDKWDSDYGVRRFFSGRKKNSGTGSRVLLPSAYRNVSRVLAAYASLLPDRRFLLVTTRANAELRELPRQVDAAPLAAYASVPRNQKTEREIAALTRQWQVEKKKLFEAQPDLRHSAGLFHGFERMLQSGLRIRDAWRHVLERERIDSVMCGDENHPYTRLAVLLARRGGVPTVGCAHGALDANVLLRGPCSDIYLAKGEMEAEYLVRECGVPSQRLFIGAAPALHLAKPGGRTGTHVVFFSEPYELYSGRTEILYRELLPRLCAMAREQGRRVMVKLHPFESLAARTQLVDGILNEAERKLVDLTAEPFSEQLLGKAWFGLTVESSVAVECAIAEVPCFLCGWFDIDLYSYGKQYAKFGAARVLNSAEDVSRIAALLGRERPDAEVRNRLYRPITPEELAAVLQGKMAASERHELSAS